MNSAYQASVDVELEPNPLQAGEPSLILSLTVPDPDDGEPIKAVLRLHFGEAVGLSAFLLDLLLESTKIHPEAHAIRHLLHQPFET